jgi:predicted O-methyltransferase YrrM
VPRGIAKRIAKKLIVRGGRMGVGRALIHAAVMEPPAERRLRNVEAWPESLSGFEDLAFLFTTGELNHGVASLSFDEAAHLFRVARSLGPATIVEIGRFKGGSTLVFATAKHPDATLWSFDLAGERARGIDGEEVDQEIASTLARYGRDAGVHLVRADSRSADHPDGGCDLVFVDGDHSYEGVRADYEHWRAAVRLGGHLLFHDAAQPERYAAVSPGVTRVVDEIERSGDSGFVREPGAGSIAHFRRNA